MNGGPKGRNATLGPPGPQADPRVGVSRARGPLGVRFARRGQSRSAPTRGRCARPPPAQHTNNINNNRDASSHCVRPLLIASSYLDGTKGAERATFGWVLSAFVCRFAVSVFPLLPCALCLLACDLCPRLCFWLPLLLSPSACCFYFGLILALFSSSRLLLQRAPRGSSAGGAWAAPDERWTTRSGHCRLAPVLCACLCSPLLARPLSRPCRGSLWRRFQLLGPACRARAAGALMVCCEPQLLGSPLSRWSCVAGATCRLRAAFGCGHLPIGPLADLLHSSPK